MVTTREALREAIVKALPIDWDDRTTVVEVVPNEKSVLGGPRVIWGNPDRLADAILDAITPVLDEGVTVQYGARCLSEHCNHLDGTGIFTVRDDREEVERFIGSNTRFQLVSRRLYRGDWEVAHGET